MFKNKKKIIISKLNKYFNFQFNNELYGKAWATLVKDDPKTIKLWKNNWEKNLLNNHDLKINKLIDISKKQLHNLAKWNKKKKNYYYFSTTYD